MTQLFSRFVFSFLAFSKTPQTLYEIQVNDIHGKPVSMSQYKGQVLLIVNTASKCGFTPQLKDLETLYNKYKSKGFEILAFPSNDFKQDPAENAEIESFAKKNYEVTFPFFDKGKVSGADKQPLYQFLTDQKSGLLFKDVSWNFEKFLISRDGTVLNRWSSIVKPSSSDVVKALEKALTVKK